MKVFGVNSTNPVNKPVFKALKLSYDIERTLCDKAGANLISDLFDAGRKLENTQFLDLQVLSNFKMRIKEKGNYFSGLVEPIKIYKHSNKQLRIVGIYNGVEDESNKLGQKKHLYLKYDSQETVNKILESIRPLKGVSRLAAITKIIDDYYVKTRLTPNANPLSKRGIVSLLMSKFGDIVI